MAQRARTPILSRVVAIGALCLLLLLALSAAPLFAAIVLQYTPLDEGFQLTGATGGIDGQSSRIPVCHLTLLVKRPGFGVVHFTHTPLFDGVRLVGYELVYEDGKPATAIRGGSLAQDIVLPCIWAQLSSPIDTENFRSTISVHLTVER